jgi:ABC-2 type transport system permease protein
MKPITAIIHADFWQRRWSLTWWSVGIAVMVGIDTMLYQTVKGETAELAAAFEKMPKAVAALFADNANLLSQPGFLSGRVYYLLLPLLLTIFAIGLGASLIAKEERRGTLELLLSRPIGRTRLILGKVGVFAAAMILVGVIAAVTGCATLRAAGFDQIPYTGVIWATVSAVLLSSLFGAVAFTLTALGKPLSRTASGVAALFAFVSYLTASLASLADWLVWPARLMPYHYFHPTDMLQTGSGDYAVMAGYVVVLLVLVVVSIVGFRRRDIN